MDLQALKNPSISYRMLEQQGITRIPFSALNSTIRDMLKIYAYRVLPADILKRLLSTLQSCRQENTSKTYFYIFNHQNYKYFLQMISREQICDNGNFIITDECSIIYTEQQDASYEKCPIFSARDEKLFENIQITPYGQAFDSKHMHLLRVSTTSSTIGSLSNTIVEYSLYIPQLLQ